MQTKAQKLKDLNAMKKVLPKNSVFRANLEKTIEAVLNEKVESRHLSIMKEVDAKYRIEVLKEYKVSHIFSGQEFVRRFESRAALNTFMKKLTKDVNLNVTITSRSIYVA